MNTIRLSSLAAAALLAVSIAFGAAAPAVSQEIPPEQLALARKYVDLTNKAQVYEAVMALTAAQTSNLLVQQNPDLEDVINETIGEVLKTRADKGGELYDQLARMYALHYTVEELNQIIAFYETPVGQKVASNATAIQQESGDVMKVFTTNFLRDFERAVKVALKEKGHDV